ncbi:MAG: hypothetical protein COA95_09290 [Methylophaga sp.]|nr:MAG: hypothetical protein COA95_09290 [Methylophaga sp.]
MIEAIEKLMSHAAFFQIAFYIVSPVATFLAVGTAYFAIYRQSKPNIILYYELSEASTVIDLVICNHGSGAARDIEFSVPIPLGCWGMSSSDDTTPKRFLDSKIPVLAPNKELRYQAGQYGGLFSQIGESFTVAAKYSYRTPLRNGKRGEDTSILDIRYMSHMNSKNSAAYDLSDAMKGRNNTIFSELNKSLKSIDGKLGLIASSIQNNENSD